MIAITIPSRPGGRGWPCARERAAIVTGVLLELLADSTRRRILALLLENREICVCAWLARSTCRSPRCRAISPRCARRGCSVSRRKGTWILYSVFDPQVPGWAMRVIGMMVEGDGSIPQLGHGQ